MTRDDIAFAAQAFAVALSRALAQPGTVDEDGTPLGPGAAALIADALTWDGDGERYGYSVAHELGEIGRSIDRLTDTLDAIAIAYFARRRE